MPADYSEAILGIEPTIEYRYNEVSGKIIAYGTGESSPDRDLTEDAASSATREVAGPSADYLAVAFDGVVDNFKLGTGGENFSQAATGTWLCCFRIPVVHAQVGTTYAFGESTNGSTHTIGMVFNANEKLEWVTNGPAGVYAYWYNTVVDDGVWHTAMVTQSGVADGMEIYIDGNITEVGEQLAKTGSTDGSEWWDDVTQGNLLSARNGARPDNSAATRFQGEFSVTAWYDGLILTPAQFNAWDDRIRAGVALPPGFSGGGPKRNQDTPGRVRRRRRRLLLQRKRLEEQNLVEVATVEDALEVMTRSNDSASMEVMLDQAVDLGKHFKR